MAATFGLFVAWVALVLFSGVATVAAFVLIDIIVPTEDPHGSGWPYLGLILAPLVMIGMAGLAWPF